MLRPHYKIPNRRCWRSTSACVSRRTTSPLRHTGWTGWQRSRKSGRWYAHIEPSVKSRARLRDKVREQLNHWTLHRRIPEAVDDLNKLLRGWSGYFHYRQSTRVFGKTQHWVRDRLRRWL